MYCSETADGEVQSLLYVQKTTEQQRLMAIYGNELSLLDATYKVCKYEVKYFFVDFTCILRCTQHKSLLSLNSIGMWIKLINVL